MLNSGKQLLSLMIFTVITQRIISFNFYILPKLL